MHVQVALVVLDGAPLTVTLKENLGVAYLAQQLREEGISTAIIDAPEQDGASIESVFCEICALHPKIVGFSVMFSNIGMSLDLARRLKQAMPGVTIILGGHQTLKTARDILKHEPQVDLVFVGEAEASIASVASAILGHAQPRGLMVYPAGVVHSGNMDTSYGFGVTSAIDELRPARDVAAYRARKGKFPIVFVSASRGCYANCTFCSDPVINRLSGSPRWRPRAVAAVLDEIEDLVTTFGTKYVIFCDDDFIGSHRRFPSRLAAFASGLIERGLNIRYRFSTRAVNLLEITDNEFRSLRASGLDRIYVGVESGSAEDLRRFKKGISVAKNLSVFARMRAVQVPLQIGFIMLHPYTTHASLGDNCEFLRATGQAVFFKNYCQEFEAFPGTELSEAVRADGLYCNPGKVYRDCSYRYEDPRVAVFKERLQDAQAKHTELDNLLFKVFYSVPRYIQDTSQAAILSYQMMLALADEIAANNHAFVRSVMDEVFCASTARADAGAFARTRAAQAERCAQLLSEFESREGRYAEYASCVKE